MANLFKSLRAFSEIPDLSGGHERPMKRACFSSLILVSVIVLSFLVYLGSPLFVLAGPSVFHHE